LHGGCIARPTMWHLYVTANLAYMCIAARERTRVSFACTGTAVAAVDLSQGDKLTP